MVARQIERPGYLNTYGRKPLNYQENAHRIVRWMGNKFCVKPLKFGSFFIVMASMPQDTNKMVSV